MHCAATQSTAEHSGAQQSRRRAEQSTCLCRLLANAADRAAHPVPSSGCPPWGALLGVPSYRWWTSQGRGLSLSCSTSRRRLKRQAPLRPPLQSQSAGRPVASSPCVLRAPCSRSGGGGVRGGGDGTARLAGRARQPCARYGPQARATSHLCGPTRPVRRCADATQAEARCRCTPTSGLVVNPTPAAPRLRHIRRCGLRHHRTRGARPRRGLDRLPRQRPGGDPLLRPAREWRRG